MVQATCQTLAGLSEIEKYILFMISRNPGMQIPVFYARFRYPMDFLKKVIEILVDKGLAIIDPTGGAVSVKKNLDPDEFVEGGLFSRLSSGAPPSFSFPPENYHRLMKVVDYLYQHSLDLYILDYKTDAIERINEILKILENDFMSNFQETLCDLDAEFFEIFEHNRRFFNDENARLLIDFSLNMIYKIKNNVREIVEKEGNPPIAASKYKEFYGRQQGAIEDLVRFLEPFRQAKREKATIGSSEANIISAYFILYFHKKIGPLVFFETKNNLDDVFKSQITKLMDMVNPGPFLYTIQATTIWNLQFELDSPLARGNKEYLQISIVLSNPDARGISVIDQIVPEIIDKIRRTKDVYKIFYIDEKNDAEDAKPERNLLVRLKNDFICNFRVLNEFIR